MKRSILKVIRYFLIFIAILFIFSIFWVKNTFGYVNLDSLIYHLTTNLEGTSSEMINKFILDPFVKSAIVLIILVIIFEYKYKFVPFISFKFFKYKKEDVNLFKVAGKLKNVFLILAYILALALFCVKFDLIAYIKNMYTYSTFIEENYVDPETTEIVFKEKRNLIHIYVESLESTFLSKEYGGAYEENLLPNLTKYLHSNISFTNNHGGGFYNSRATGWTIAGMVGQTAGVGLIVSNGNDYGNDGDFLGGSIFSRRFIRTQRV